MDTLTNEVKICSALMNKSFFDWAEELYEQTEKHIKEKTFSSIKKVENKSYVNSNREINQEGINRINFINSLVNCINFFEEEKVILNEEKYLVTSGYHSSPSSFSYDTCDSDYTKYYINYVTILHKDNEVFWLSTENEYTNDSSSSTYLHSSSNHDEKSNLDEYITLYDLYFMKSFNTLRKAFPYFIFLESLIIKTVEKNKKSVSNDDIIKFLKEFLKLYKIKSNLTVDELKAKFLEVTEPEAFINELKRILKN